MVVCVLCCNRLSDQMECKNCAPQEAPQRTPHCGLRRMFDPPREDPSLNIEMLSSSHGHHHSLNIISSTHGSWKRDNLSASTVAAATVNRAFGQEYRRHCAGPPRQMPEKRLVSVILFPTQPLCRHVSASGRESRAQRNLPSCSHPAFSLFCSSLTLDARIHPTPEQHANRRHCC